MFKKSFLALTFSVLGAQAFGDSSTETALWKAIKEQQVTIDALKEKLGQTEEQVKNTDKKIEATADAVSESAKTNGANETFVGGYGEMHYNQWNNQLDTGKDKRELDFHRFVLLFGHQFTDSVRFFSEFELEHAVAGEGKKGEVELEQAYIQWDFTRKHNLKAGVFLVPIGIINETHEPETFYGVERNAVENKIIPSTWWEGGAAVSGELAEGWSYDLAAHSGLALPDKKFLVRDGRQKVSEAKANTKAYTGRIKFTGIAGLEVASSLQYQEDFLQDQNPTAIAATLWEAHAQYQLGQFSLRALFAEWDIDDAIQAIATGADKQKGWYVEPSYRFSDQWGGFARYSLWDNQASDSGDSEFTETSVGINFWLTETTVFKLDLFTQNAPLLKDEFSGFNLGVGYSF